MDPQNRFKVREFLRVNLTTLQGEPLREFMERYSVMEANAVQMMILDQGMQGHYIAFGNPERSAHYFVATEDVMEKILLLAPLNPETENILEET